MKHAWKERFKVEDLTKLLEDRLSTNKIFNIIESQYVMNYIQEVSSPKS